MQKSFGKKGTNRSSFFRGEVDKYGWVDVGSSFLPSEITAAFLWAQLEELENIQRFRIQIWNAYYEGLKDWANINNVELPKISNHATNNAHMFYLVCPELNSRNYLIKSQKAKKIHAVFHYQSLHKSPFYKSKHDGRELPESDRFSDCLVRLPMWVGLEVEMVVSAICEI